MKKSERKEIYSKIAISLNKGKNKDAYEHLRNVASEEGLFILSEYKSNNLVESAQQLLEALEFVMSRSRGTSGRIIIELHEEDKLISAIKAAKGE